LYRALKHVNRTTPTIQVDYSYAAANDQWNLLPSCLRKKNKKTQNEQSNGSYFTSINECKHYWCYDRVLCL